MHPLIGRLGTLGLTSLACSLLGLALAEPSQAAAPDESSRPATWDMSREQLQELGLGQSCADPVPVPAEFPLRNVEAPPAHGGQPPPKIIFVNFNGETLVGGPDDAKTNTTQLPELEGVFAPYGVGDKRTAVMQATRADWAPYNINVVDTRPASGEYTMNMTGPTNPYGGGVLGIAPVDCGNFQTHSNITYAFHSIDDGFDASTTATTIGQEVAHSYGLEHVDEPADILNPFNAGGDPSFIDECLPMTGGAFCPEQHLLHCPDGTGQNSHQELLTMFGPSIPDVDGPIITVTAPLNNTTYDEGDGFTVIAEIIDDSLVDEATLYANGEVFDIDTTAPWGWQVTSLPPGLYTLEIVAVDEYGNEGLSNPVSILMGGDPLPSGTGAVDDSGGDSLDGPVGSDSGNEPAETDSAGLVPGNPADGCACSHRRDGGYGPVPGFAWGLLLLGGLARRRRPRA